MLHFVLELNFVGFLTSLFLLAFANVTYAGGAHVYISAGSSLVSWNTEYRNIITKVHLHPDFPCVGTKITFTYEDQKEGDSVATTTEHSNTAIIEEVGARWLNGKSVYDCGTYAKYASKNRELKYAVIVISTPDGETHERKVALNFQSNEPIVSSDESLPWDWEFFAQPTSNPAPSGNINAWVLNQEVVPLDSRKVTVKWGAFDGYPGTFTIYVKSESNKNDWEEKFDGSKGPSATFTLRAEQDYHIKVHGCMDKFGTCVDSNVLLLPKIQIQENKVVFPSPSTIAEPSSDSNTEQLNKKVEDLQNQLEESKKTQSVLEQRINGLVDFIKKLFPFFNK